jgi:SEA/GATOR complex protein SEA1/DEPDC5
MSATKTIYRSLSAKMTIFIQVCHELWEFAGDGERYYEKIVHSFLPALFSRWSDAGAKHTVTIVFISRVHYDQTEVEYAAGPLRQDDDGKWYKDFYKVVTDLESIQDWRPTLVSLKDSFFAFQRDILLTHHYHRAFRMAETAVSSGVSSNAAASAEVRLVGTLSYAHDGPILEAINLILNPTETHYIDRSLSLTGASIILITPGTGYFVVQKRLLRTTTLRLLDQGFGLDLISLAKKPLHRTPIFTFKGEIPELRAHNPEKDGRIGSSGGRELDPLWGGGDGESLLKTQFWWEPFWISTTFWDQQMDLPFRVDRFVARARMHEIQMLGLLEHDLLSTIEVPYLDVSQMHPAASSEVTDPRTQADNFDIDTFALNKNYASTTVARNSLGASSSSTSTIVPSMLTSSGPGRERMPMSLSSSASSKFPPIAEDQGQETSTPSSPRVRPDLIPTPAPLPIVRPPEPNANPTLSISPSRESVRSSRSVATVSSSSSKKRGSTQSQGSLASKFAPGWLFNPFRSSSQPQTSTISVTSTMTPLPRLSESSTPNTNTSPLPVPKPPKPVSIQNRRSHGRNIDDGGIFGPSRSSLPRTSPLSSSPRDREGSEALQPIRRSTMSTLALPPVASSPPRPPNNPSRLTLSVSYEQASLARRWQHVHPAPSFEHQIKWTPVLTPACLPLTVEHFPTQQELDTAFEYFSYDFVVDPPSMSSSFCIKVPGDWRNLPSQEAKDIFALAVMRGQTALRLAQGFQFILRPRGGAIPRSQEDRNFSRRSRSFAADEEIVPKPIGASEVLQTPFLPVYLSMTNEIHRLSYNGEVIKVELYVRRIGSAAAKHFDYECLVWPKRGDGYTEVSTSFKSPGLEKLGWNRCIYDLGLLYDACLPPFYQHGYGSGWL